MSNALTSATKQPQALPITPSDRAKQRRDQIDILNIGVALARQNVGTLRYERKLRPIHTDPVKVPPLEVPIEVAFAIVEDNAASRCCGPQRVLRKSLSGRRGCSA